MTQLLMTPGPTNVPQRILDALARPVIHHRTKEFSDIYDDCCTRLKDIYKTQDEVHLLAGSGTSAMDAAICNTVEPGDKVLCLSSGKFSERFAEIARAYGAEVKDLKFEWGSPIDVAEVEAVLEEDTKLVAMVHNETSTGVINPTAEIGKLLKGRNTLFAADVISCLGGDNIEMDAWNVDLCIGGSQKCLALPTGLACIAVSEKAWNVMENTKTPRYYLDLLKYRKKYPQTPFSSPVSLIFALQEALKMVEEEGLDNRIKRHDRIARATRESVKAIGLTLFPKSEEICSKTVTAINAPEDINEAELRKKMIDRFNIRLAGAQAHIKGKVFRIGHMGSVTEKELLQTLAALQECLKELGFNLKADPVEVAEQTLG